MSIYTLSIYQLSHDTSSSLFKDDELIFYCQSERLSRIKHDSIIPENLIEEISKHTTKLDLIVIHPMIRDNAQQILKKLKTNFRCNKTIVFNEEFDEKSLKHHDTHALSAFYLSPYDEAVCLIFDASGSEYTIVSDKDPRLGIRGVETTSIYEMSNNYQLKHLYKKSQCAPVSIAEAQSASKTKLGIYNINGGFKDNPKYRFKKFNYKFDASTHMDIGGMYHTVTTHLGYNMFNAGIVMGLSAYGKAENNLPNFLMGDTILSNNNLFNQDRTFNYNLYPELFEELTFQQKADMAYEVQRALEKFFLTHAEFIKQNSKIKNLVIGGGCALNILGVSAIKQKYPEFNIFVDPIAFDSTHSIGLGIEFYNRMFMNNELKKKKNFRSIFLGPKYESSEIENAIEKFMEENQC